MNGKLFLTASILVAAASLPQPASACRSGCPGSTGNIESSTGGHLVPAPAGVALFALAATLVATRRKR